jgi:two-component system, sensor histidine kinase
LLGHKVGLRSRPGQGSCFYVELDAAPAPAAVKVADAPSFSVRPHGPLRNAVLIENDLQILAAMVELLETRNIKAIPTVSADEAADAIDTMESVPDLIVADYHLDEGTGLEAIEHLRKKCGKNIPAVIVTANHSATLKSDLAKHDVALLWKPLKPHLLFEAIELVL